MISSKVAIRVGIFAIVIYLVKQYMQGASCKSKARLDGKITIITGANTGIGKANAEDFVQRGAKVYMACRSIERGEAAAKDIRESTGVADDKLIVMKLDLGSIASIKKFSEEFHERENQLHILVNNAGVMLVPYRKTVDGFEETLGVNHLGHFLLTHLLLDVIKSSAPSRIVTISAGLYKLTDINFDDIMGEKSYNSLTAYAQSKLANIMFTSELARRLKGTGVTTYSLHPGVIQTELLRHTYIENLPVIKHIARAFIWPFLKTQWHGAQTQICCSVSEDLANESGKYYSDCAQEELTETATNKETAKRLWKMSEKLLYIA